MNTTFWKFQAFTDSSSKFSCFYRKITHVPIKLSQKMLKEEQKSLTYFPKTPWLIQFFYVDCKQFEDLRFKISKFEFKVAVPLGVLWIENTSN